MLNARPVRKMLCLVITLMAISHGSFAQSIAVNQIGFAPEWQKIASTSTEQVTEFSLIELMSGQRVYSGKGVSHQAWAYSGQAGSILDFSDFRQLGQFKIRLPNGLESGPFVIQQSPLRPLLKASIRGYFLNRAGASLSEAHAGKFHRPGSHPDNIVFVHGSAASKHRPEGFVLSSAKGWFDAGDYNKYIVNSNITVYTLLMAFEDYPELFSSLALNIPESANGIPDLLDEIKWNLDWMLTMQDPHDGGVYHKLTTQNFTGMDKMPHYMNQKRFVVAKSSAATFGFAAAMAKGYEVFKTYESAFPGYAQSLLSASKKAWAWGIANPQIGYQQPADIKTGEYVEPGEGNEDEQLWAASALFLATQNKEYLPYLTLPEKLRTPAWPKVESLAALSLATSPLAPEAMASLATGKLTTLADSWVSQHSQSPYQVAIDEEDFVWGSNAVLMNKGLTLLKLHGLKPEGGYRKAAQSLLDYVLGRNPLAISFVTGFGSNRANNIHHRVSAADNIDPAIPGLLVGGANPGQQDKTYCAGYGAKYPSEFAALSFLDHTCSYASNEVAINWNAPFVYVLAGFN